MIVKNSDNSFGGKNIFLLTPSKLDDTEYSMNNYNYIFQEYVQQHSQLSRLNKYSLNTLRIITSNLCSEVQVLSSALKMGVGRNIVDNIGSGGIGVKINNNNGALTNYGLDKYFKKHYKHPLSKVIFKEYRVPGYKEAVKMCVDNHRMLFQLGFIAWDIAIDKNSKPLLIEINLKKPEINHPQIFNGPLFDKELDNIVYHIKFPRLFKLLNAIHNV